MDIPGSLLGDRKRTAAVTAVAALVVSNVVTNKRLPLAAHIPWSLGLTAGLIGAARWAGLEPDDIGLDRRHLVPSARTGGLGAAAVVAGYGALVASGAGRSLMQDQRITAVSRHEAAWHLLLRIPISTVLAEEIAFRGVLPAFISDTRGPRWLPGLVSSVLFGVWHVIPSLEGSKVNGSGARATGRTAALDVAATTLAGGALLGLRYRTRHLAAPMALHLATNTMGFLAARWLVRRR